MDSMARSSHNKLSQNKSGPREPEWMKWATLTMGCLFALLLGFVLGWFVVNRKVASAIDQIDQVKTRFERDEQFIEMLQQHPEIFTPGAYSTIFGNPSQPAGAASQPQPSPEQKAPAQKANDKGTNGKH
jgi:hypothetical protein